MEINGNANTKKIVKITWADSGQEYDNMDEECIKELHPVKLVSFGLLMVDDDERVIISSHMLTTVNHACTEGCETAEHHVDYKDTLCIPRESVLSIDVLGEQYI